MKTLVFVSILISLLLAGCVKTQQAANYDTDKYSYEALERRFGGLAPTDDKSGFSSKGNYGIWQRIYIKTTAVGNDLYRIDYINLPHREGTPFKEWKQGIETFFHVKTEVRKLTYYGEPYNGWRVELSTSSGLIESVFCWVEDKNHGESNNSVDGVVTWKWGRVLFKEFYSESKERQKRQQKEIKEQNDAQ